MAEPITMRLDRFLWYARLAKTRGAAQGMATDGHLRIDGRVVDRAHCPVRVGTVLTFAAHGDVRAIRVLALPFRRGPPPEARACYDDLTGARLTPRDVRHSSALFVPGVLPDQEQDQ